MHSVESTVARFLWKSMVDTRNNTDSLSKKEVIRKGREAVGVALLIVHEMCGLWIECKAVGAQSLYIFIIRKVIVDGVPFDEKE